MSKSLNSPQGEKSEVDWYMLRKLYITVPICFLLIACSKKTPQTADEYRAQQNEVSCLPVSFKADSLVESVIVDADLDGLPDTIRLYRPHDWVDPGDYHFISMRFGAKRHFEQQDEGGWVTLSNLEDKAGLPALRRMSIVDSKNLIVFRLKPTQCTVLLFGFQYASEPGKVTALTIYGDRVDKVFDDEIAITSIADIDGDGIPDLIGCHYFEEWGEDSVHYETYNPFRIFSLDSFKPVAESVVRQYNLAHYAGYPEPGSTGPYVVLRVNNSKRFVMNEDEAYAKYGR